ncbi:MAG: hypothetical protein JNG89_20640 [Planctomycetaceae bacterium]|nr:hypothetical protein [Planctomycetaceae bacterium]
MSAEPRVAAIRFLLRAFGAVDCLALIAVLMPRAVIESASLRLGFAPFSPGPLAEYLARSTSLLYALHGALMLYVASDVPRHWGLIRCLGLLAVVHGVLMLMIDVRIGMPGWWCAIEGPTFAASGIALWMLTNRGEETEQERTEATENL